MSSSGPSETGTLFSKEEWEKEATRVTTEMKMFTQKFATPVSRVIDHDYGISEGTGNYIEISGRSHLLTNEHVAQALNTHSLSHQFLNDDTVYRVIGLFHAEKWPLDVAVSAIEDKVWTSKPHDSKPISEDKWALAHVAVPGELLFMKGFAGAGAKFHFGALISSATSYSCREVSLPTDDRFHSRFHFGLDYRPDKATELDGRSLPDPHGLSGSLVWNTRLVECTAKQEKWTPDCARVTGLVWGWPSSAACLVATRAEYVRSFLLRFTQK